MQSVNMSSGRTTLAIQGTDVVLFLVNESVSSSSKLAEEISDSK
jgi:hypothetical protein